MNAIVADHGRFGGDRAAFVLGERARTWRELDARIDRVASALARRGIGVGTTVALLAPNGFEAVEIIFGAARAGAPIVPLSPLLQPEVLDRIVADAESALLFAGAPYQELARQISGFGRSRRFAIGFKDAEFTPYDEFVAGAGTARFHRDYDPHDLFAIIYSSGTTGIPKGIVHTDFGRLQMGFLLGIEFNIDATAVTLLATPPFTNGTWMTMIPTMTAGGCCVLLPAFSVESFLEAVARHRVTHVFLVPTQIRAILESPRLADYDLSSLRRVISAGAALPAPLRTAWTQRFGATLMELYGVTEGVGTTIKPPESARKPGSVGVPAVGTDLRIVGDDGREVPRGEIGEIVGRTSAVMLGYHNRPEADREATWISPEGDAFLRTGDIGRLDEDGYLYIVDRKKDMIVSGGINVFPSDIEAVVRAHTAIRDASVIGVPDEKWGETPVAVVVLREPSASAEEILEWCNARLSKHQRLLRVRIEPNDLPRNALGKVLKTELRLREANLVPNRSV